MNDPIGDILTRIRNSQMRKKLSFTTPASNMHRRVLDVLRDEGYILGYEEKKDQSKKSVFVINLKYYRGRPAIQEIKRISKPGRRVYQGYKDIPRIRQGLGITIVSTSQGVMSGEAARAASIGGEILGSVF